MGRREWLRRRTYDGAGFDPADLVARKREAGQRISVCLPARDVAATVGEIVAAVRRDLMGPDGLVDEVVVIDSDSADDTAAVAIRAGADVHRARDILPGVTPLSGKGEALWKSLAVVTADIVVWLDADVAPFDSAFVPGLVGPLLLTPEIDYVKALYRRDLDDRRGDGGRVTEICARPLINLVHPHLAAFAQPLAGEAAGRTAVLRTVPFLTGYAVEMGLLIELCERLGLARLAQVDLGERRHRHQPTPALGRMAHEIARLALEGAMPGLPDATACGAAGFARPVRGEHGWTLETTRDPLVRRPPLDSLEWRRVVAT